MGQYACEECGEICSRKEIDIDHIEPIISLEHGFDEDWQGLILRLFCEADGLQGICKPCHRVKTMNEDEIRRHYSAKRKEDEKKETKKKLNKEAKARKKEKEC